MEGTRTKSTRRMELAKAVGIGNGARRVNVKNDWWLDSQELDLKIEGQD
jgi:hypothetical protein